MMNKRKWLGILLAAAMACSTLTGCDGVDADAESVIEDTGEAAEAVIETAAEETVETAESTETQPEMVDTTYTVGVTSVTDDRIIAYDADGNAYVLELADELSEEETAMIAEGSILTVTETAQVGEEKTVGARISNGSQLVKAYTMNVTAVAAAEDEAAVDTITDTYFTETKPEKQVASTNTTTNTTSNANASSNTNNATNSSTSTGSSNQGVVYFSAYGDSSTVDSGSSYTDNGDNGTTETTTGDGGNIEPTLCTDFVGYVNNLRDGLRANGGLSI